MLPLAPSSSQLPWAVENLRFCPWCDQLAQKDLNDCPDLRPAHGAARSAGGRSLSARAAVVALALLLAGGTLGACGGGSSVSDAVPKSTPDITPPNDTSAEKAAAQTTSTSTTSTSKTLDRAKAPPSESGGNEATEEPESGGSASGAGEAEATPSGGAAAEKEKDERKIGRRLEPDGRRRARPTGK